MRRNLGNLIVLSTYLVFGWLAVSPTAQATLSSLVVSTPVGESQPAKVVIVSVEKASDDSAENPAENKADKDSDSGTSVDKESSSAEKAPNEADADKKPEKTTDKTKKEKAKKKAKPYKVKRDKLKTEVKLDGIFVSEKMEEVILRPEVWTKFKVLEAAEHGARVKKGDVLIRFDDEKLEEDLAKEAHTQRLDELSLMQDEEEYPRLKRMLELAFENAERRHAQVKEDYDYYYSTDRPTTIRIAKYRLKSAGEQLASAQEELNQLQQMYEADELTEQTEEIVLRRQRFAVETATLVHELGKAGFEQTMNVSVPRRDQYFETVLEEAELSFKQLKTAKEIGLTRKSYEMEKKRDSRARSIERHAKLLSDKGLMTIRAPMDGVVYYGKCSKGKWSQITSMKAKLKPFGSATANTVLMTIVQPEALCIESNVGEKDLADLKAGLEATVVPTADKELELAGKVVEVATIPAASNKFKVDLSFDASETPEWLVPGMTCEAKVVTYENKEALVVPLDLVQTDEEDEKTKYVMLVDSDKEKPSRRNIKLGRKQGKLVEVLEGLEEGNQIVKEEKKDED